MSQSWNDPFGPFFARVSAFFRWLYEWVTVIVAAAVGVLSEGIDILNAIVGSTDISPLFSPATAVKIVTAVAILKGIHAWYQSQKAAG